MKLPGIDSQLTVEYRNKTILGNRLLNAVINVDSCNFTNRKPVDTVQGVISD